MKEKEMVKTFITEDLGLAEKKLGFPVRVYSIEFPLRYNGRNKRADLLLIKDEKELILMEFKAVKINYGVVEQIKLYEQLIAKQLYMPIIRSIIVGNVISEYETQVCKDNNVSVWQYCPETHYLRENWR